MLPVRVLMTIASHCGVSISYVQSHSNCQTPAPYPWVYSFINGTTCQQLYVQEWSACFVNATAAPPFQQIMTSVDWVNGTCPPTFFNAVAKVIACDNPALALVTFSSESG
jgi:hypothetical protein